MSAPFLSNLGLSDADQKRNPVATEMVPAFNPMNRRTWATVVNDLEIGPDVLANWGLAIRNYVDECTDQNRYPFNGDRQSVNDAIFSHLMQCRRKIVKFMDASQILTHCTLRSVERSCKMDRTGFVVRVRGSIIIEDPTLKEWLLRQPYPAFQIRKEGSYIKKLDEDTMMYVTNNHADGPLRWFMGYDIACNQFPDIPGHHVPTATDLEKFVMNVMWLPVMKSHRPRGFHRRLL